MKRLLFFIAILATFAVATFAQQRADNNIASMTFHQVEELRKPLGLDKKQFDKVYKAYEKYNREVFGSMTNSRPGRPGGRMDGQGPGGHGGQHMGGGRPPMGQPGMGRPHSDNESRRLDPEKQKKLMAKQEEKLTKSMKKILRDPHRFGKWLEIRRIQLSKHPQPRHPQHR